MNLGWRFNFTTHMWRSVSTEGLCSLRLMLVTSDQDWSTRGGSVQQLWVLILIFHMRMMGTRSVSCCDFVSKTFRLLFCPRGPHYLTVRSYLDRFVFEKSGQIYLIWLWWRCRTISKLEKKYAASEPKHTEPRSRWATAAEDHAGGLLSASNRKQRLWFTQAHRNYQQKTTEKEPAKINRSQHERVDPSRLYHWFRQVVVSNGAGGISLAHFGPLSTN